MHVAAHDFPDEFASQFWEQVLVGEVEECWPWLGSDDGWWGYGHLRFNDKDLKTHRVAYELTHGPFRGWVLHRCDNPPCCNPNHLFLGDAKANALDMEAKGRHPHRPARGTSHGNSKLTEAAVTELLAMRPLKRGQQREFARRWGVSESIISDILRGKRNRWSHVPR